MKKTDKKEKFKVINRCISTQEISSGIVFWVEKKGIEQPWPIAMHHIRNAHLLTAQEWVDYYGDVWKLNEYATTWRLWTEMPTDWQREAVKWNG